MILKLIDTTGEKIYYSQDIIAQIRAVNNVLMETYPECAEFCIKIEEIINECNRIL